MLTYVIPTYIEDLRAIYHSLNLNYVMLTFMLTYIENFWSLQENNENSIYINLH